MDTATETLGQRLERLRKAAGLSMAQLAQQAAADPSNLSKVERGQRSGIDSLTAERLAKALGTTPGHLLFGDVPAADAPTGQLTIPHNLIHPSPFNPRKSFDQAKLWELAESILAKGIIEPVVVRPRHEGGYWLVAGERRWRAVQLLVEGGAGKDGWKLSSCEGVAADYPMPAVVKVLTDAEHIELAIIENLQREDVPALEEAEAFARLEELGRTKKEIAAAIGKVPEYVQQRVRLLTRLCPAAKAALAMGTVSFTQALVLASVSHDRQQDVLGKLDRYPTAARLKEALFGDLVPTSRAIFPVEDSGLDTVTDETTGRTYFKDRAAFHSAQQRAVERRKAELEAEGWAWVEIKDHIYAGWYEEERTADKALGGAVIHKDFYGKVTEHVGLVEKKEDPAALAAKAVARAKQEAEEAAREEFRDRLVRRLSMDGPMVIRLCVLSFMADDYSGRAVFNSSGVKLLTRWVEENPMRPGVPPVLSCITHLPLVRCNPGLVEMKLQGHGQAGDANVLALTALLKADDDDLYAVWVAEMARRLFVSYGPAGPLEMMLARHYKIPVPPHMLPAGQADLEDTANGVRQAAE